MGGSIAVESELGRGSTFSFTARFGLQAHQPLASAAAQPISLRNLRVLVVDDNAANRNIMEKWLEGWEMDPTAVGDGMAAMDALWHGVAVGKPHALLLLDARMPDTDGLSLAAKIRERAELSGGRIVLLTSGDRPGDLARFRELRIDGHLLKPVQQHELLETIYSIMSRTGEPWGSTRPGSSSDPARMLLPAGPRLRILVAEDSEFNAQLMQKLLATRGHTVQLVGNGREALALANADDFDLLLLDVHMPELDGFEVIRAIRQRERDSGSHLPVIALTARSRKEDREQCLAAGMDDFLAKPIQTDGLWAAIERVLAAFPQGPAQPASAPGRVRRQLRYPARHLRWAPRQPAIPPGSDSRRPPEPRCEALARGRPQIERNGGRFLNRGRWHGIGPGRFFGSRPIRSRRTSCAKDRGGWPGINAARDRRLDHRISATRGGNSRALKRSVKAF